MTTVISRDDLARRIAQDIPIGAVVNLGIGAPTTVSNFLEPDRDVVLHTENGMLAMGPEAQGDEIDPDIINAGKIPVTELPGASYFHHADSFAMMRGGHLDVCVLGAFQVSQYGDLANWITNKPDAIPAVGGAMDLAIGAKNVWVMTDLLTKDGHPKVLDQCTFPLTGVRCVNRIYTEHCVLGIDSNGLHLIDGFGGNTAADISALLNLPVSEGPGGHNA
jgi:3-oxoadipate CoA-transferase beta subunit